VAATQNQGQLAQLFACLPPKLKDEMPREQTVPTGTTKKASKRIISRDARRKAAETNAEDLNRRWSSAAKELEDIDKVIADLRSELRSFEVRREIIAKREETLRMQVKSMETKPEATLESQKNEERPPRPIGTRLEVDTNPKTDFNSKEPQTPVFHPLEGKAFKWSDSLPSAFHGLDEPADTESVDTSSCKVVNVSTEDWEHGLEALGVAKCGVCGTKSPLDVRAIEKHCLECEQSQRDSLMLLKTKQPTTKHHRIYPLTASQGKVPPRSVSMGDADLLSELGDITLIPPPMAKQALKVG